MKTLRVAARFALGLGALTAAATAQAANPCIGDAKTAFVECKADCKESYQTAKDACLSRDHACVEGCRAGRAECIDATSLDEDLLVCRDALRAAKDDCRTTHAGDDAATDACIDQAQTVAFLCRKAARRAAKPAISACRSGFKACAKACPTVGDVVIDRVLCKSDAKTAYLACKGNEPGGCREEFQSQKDLCLNRDHACVEGCRADRDACRQPIEDQLDADLAACKATKTAAVANCLALYPEGPDRDACVTAALVDAFQCRDQARENAKPGFTGCRDAFRACATACPPAS
jgi:hypothetical protein